MKKYVFIIGKKIDSEIDFPRLSQCYSTVELAEIALEELRHKYSADYISNKIISTEQELDELPDDCWYIRAIEYFCG